MKRLLASGWERALILIVLMSSVLSVARGQDCSPQWLPGAAVPGVGDGTTGLGTVRAAAQLGNGDIVAGGTFTALGSSEYPFRSRIATDPVIVWDGYRWSSLWPLNSVKGRVNALLVAGDGRLFVGGSFSGGRTLYVWDGQSVRQAEPAWSGGEVFALAKVSSSEIAVASSAQVYRLNGSVKTPIGSAFTGGVVRALAVLPSGELIAAGDFTGNAGQTINRIARFDGVKWVQIGGGVSAVVNALLALPNGELIAAGSFTTAGGNSASRIAQWDGSTWRALSSGLDNTVNSLAALPDGRIIAGGTFGAAGGVAASRVAAWNGSAWSSLDSSPTAAFSSDATVYSVTPLRDGNVFFGGVFRTAGRLTANSMVLWTPQGWRVPHNGVSGVITAMSELPDGTIAAAGDFENASGRAAIRVAVWNGITWSSLGPSDPADIGLIAGNAFIHSIVPGPQGGIVAAAIQGAVPVNRSHNIIRVSHWDGMRWSVMEAGMINGGQSTCLRRLSNGDMVVGGPFKYASRTDPTFIGAYRWNGARWEQLGNLDSFDLSSVAVGDLALGPDGGLFAMTTNIYSGNVKVQRWDGTSWSRFGDSLPFGSQYGKCIYFAADGQMYVSGALGSGGFFLSGVRRFAGWDWEDISGFDLNTYSQLNILAIPRIFEFPVGELVAVGRFTHGSGGGVSRLRNGQWEPLGEVGLEYDGSLETGSPFNAVVSTKGQEVLVGGSFTGSSKAGNAAYFARWTDNPMPWVALEPGVGWGLRDGIASIEAAPASGYSNVSYQWERETEPGSEVFVPIVDGIGGIAEGGGLVEGSSGALRSPTGATPARLRIIGAQPADAVRVRITFSNACGSATSSIGEIRVRCNLADLNGNDEVDFGDFLEFFNCFDAAAPCGDIDGVAGTDFGDFLVFFNSYDVGC